MADSEVTDRPNLAGQHFDTTRGDGMTSPTDLIPKITVEAIKDFLGIKSHQHRHHHHDENDGSESAAHWSLRLNASLRLMRIQVLFMCRQIHLARTVLDEATFIADALEDNLLKARCQFWAGAIDAEDTTKSKTVAIASLVDAADLLKEDSAELCLLSAILHRHCSSEEADTTAQSRTTMSQQEKTHEKSIKELFQSAKEQMDSQSSQTAGTSRRSSKMMRWFQQTDSTPFVSSFSSDWKGKASSEAGPDLAVGTPVAPSVVTSDSFISMDRFLRALQNPKDDKNRQILQRSRQRLVNSTFYTHDDPVASVRGSYASASKSLRSTSNERSVNTVLQVEERHNQSLSRSDTLNGPREGHQQPCRESKSDLSSPVLNQCLNSQSSTSLQLRGETDSKVILPPIDTQAVTAKVPKSQEDGGQDPTFGDSIVLSQLTALATKINNSKTMTFGSAGSNRVKAVDTDSYGVKNNNSGQTFSTTRPTQSATTKIILTDTLTPEEIDERVKTTVGRRKSDLQSTKTLTHPTIETRLVNTRRLSTDPSSPSPLRRSSAPSDFEQRND